VLLQQLLQPDMYPEKAANSVAAQARAKVFIYVRTLARARFISQAKVFIYVRTLACARIHQRSLFSCRVRASLRRLLRGQLSLSRRVTLLALVLLAAAVLFRLRRGNTFHVLRFVLQHWRR
jgi:hypothetical protein